MPLDRDHMTLASRVTTKVYPVFAAVVGLSLTVTPLERLRATPSFAFADNLWGIRPWGVGFLVAAVVMTLALVLHNRNLYLSGLAALCFWLVAFSGITVAAAFSGEASFAAWVWPASIAVFCWASHLSLLARET